MGSEAGAITGYLANIGIDLPAATLPGGTATLSLVYGVGTAVPVLVVAFVLALSANAVGKVYNVLSRVELWARMTTGTVFILAGMWFSLRYVFDV
jgi:cytochrome c biogenesis protein CcdA